MEQLDMLERSAMGGAQVIQILRPEQSVEDKAAEATLALRRLFQQNKTASVSFSGGKDSSVLMHLTLEAAKQAKAAGEPVRVVVFSSDTGVENPEVALLLRREHKKIRSAFARHGIEHEVILTQPSLAASWPVRVLGGSKLPSFPGGSHDCAVDFKVNPIRSARNSVFRKLGKDNTVTLIGTRFDESAERARNMTERGELADTPYRNEEGELVMSPIAFWSTDDVWELIGLARAGVIESYSNFDDTFKLYADAGGTSCAVVSDAITEGTKKARGGCGARFGCFVCVAVSNDTSLDTMIATDEQYAYMAGVNRFRNFIAKTRWDFSRRYWIQRTLDDSGRVKIQPDCYSPAFLLELFRYAASLDRKERVAAARGRHPVRFQILTEEHVVAIDALWSLNGYHPPHTALLEWLSISEGRSFYEVPDVSELEEVARKPVPTAFMHQVGDTWDSAEFHLYTGSRDLASALAGDVCRPTRTASDGRDILDVETEARMAVDVEGLSMALDFEMDGILERHNAPPENNDWTAGYRFWLSYGALSLSPGQVAEYDTILRRTAWRAENGFLGEPGNLRAQQMALQAQSCPQTGSLFAEAA